MPFKKSTTNNIDLTDYLAKTDIVANVYTPFNPMFISKLYVNWLSSTSISVSTGSCMGGNSTMLSLSSSIVKNFSNSSYVLGNYANGLASNSGYYLNNKWYYVFIIKTGTGAIDIMFDTTNPIAHSQITILASRLLGYFRTDNSYNIMQFITVNLSDNITEHLWYQPSANDWSYSASSEPTTATLKTSMAPPNSLATLTMGCRSSATTTNYCLLNIWSPLIVANPGSYPNAMIMACLSITMNFQFNIRLNENSQYYIQRTSSTGSFDGFLNCVTTRYTFSR